MKKINIYIMFLAALLTWSLCFGQADTTKNNTARYEDLPGMVRYYGTTTTSSDDSIGIDYTQAFYIAPLTTSNAMWSAVMSNAAGGTEDCNVVLEYSFDLTTWFAASLASGMIKEQLTTTRIVDTLNVQTGSSDPYYKAAIWARLKNDYQAGNPIGTVLSWDVVFRKASGSENIKFGRVENSKD